MGPTAPNTQPFWPLARDRANLNYHSATIGVQMSPQIKERSCGKVPEFW